MMWHRHPIYDAPKRAPRREPDQGSEAITPLGIDLGLGWLAIAPRQRPWLQHSQRGIGAELKTTDYPTRQATLDFRRGYQGAWALRRVTESVARPFLLRTSLKRLGSEGAPEASPKLRGYDPKEVRP